MNSSNYHNAKSPVVHSSANLVVHDSSGKILSKRDVAELLSVNPRTINTLMKRSDFPVPLRVGRILRWIQSDIYSWIEQQIAANGKQRHGRLRTK